MVCCPCRFRKAARPSRSSKAAGDEQEKEVAEDVGVQVQTETEEGVSQISEAAEAMVEAYAPELAAAVGHAFGNHFPVIKNIYGCVVQLYNFYKASRKAKDLLNFTVSLLKFAESTMEADPDSMPLITPVLEQLQDFTKSCLNQCSSRTNPNEFVKDLDFYLKKLDMAINMETLARVDKNLWSRDEKIYVAMIGLTGRGKSFVLNSLVKGDIFSSEQAITVEFTENWYEQCKHAAMTLSPDGKKNIICRDRDKLELPVHQVEGSYDTSFELYIDTPSPDSFPLHLKADGRTTEYKAHYYDGVIYQDTPGIVINGTHDPLATNEIEKALLEEGLHMICFVVAGKRGQVDGEELEMMHGVLQACENIMDYHVIINQIPQEEMPLFQKNMPSLIETLSFPGECGPVVRRRLSEKDICLFPKRQPHAMDTRRYPNYCQPPQGLLDMIANGTKFPITDKDVHIRIRDYYSIKSMYHIKEIYKTARLEAALEIKKTKDNAEKNLNTVKQNYPDVYEKVITKMEVGSLDAADVLQACLDEMVEQRERNSALFDCGFHAFVRKLETMMSSRQSDSVVLAVKLRTVSRDVEEANGQGEVSVIAE